MEYRTLDLAGMRNIALGHVTQYEADHYGHTLALAEAQAAGNDAAARGAQAVIDEAAERIKVADAELDRLDAAIAALPVEIPAAVDEAPQVEQ